MGIMNEIFISVCTYVYPVKIILLFIFREYANTLNLILAFDDDEYYGYIHINRVYYISGLSLPCIYDIIVVMPFTIILAKRVRALTN